MVRDKIIPSLMAMWMARNLNKQQEPATMMNKPGIIPGLEISAASRASLVHKLLFDLGSMLGEFKLFC